MKERVVIDTGVLIRVLARSGGDKNCKKVIKVILENCSSIVICKRILKECKTNRALKGFAIASGSIFTKIYATFKKSVMERYRDDKIIDTISDKIVEGDHDFNNSLNELRNVKIRIGKKVLHYRDDDKKLLTCAIAAGSKLVITKDSFWVKLTQINLKYRGENKTIYFKSPEELLGEQNA